MLRRVLAALAVGLLASACTDHARGTDGRPSVPPPSRPTTTPATIFHRTTLPSPPAESTPVNPTAVYPQTAPTHRPTDPPHRPPVPTELQDVFPAGWSWRQSGPGVTTAPYLPPGSVWYRIDREVHAVVVTPARFDDLPGGAATEAFDTAPGTFTLGAYRAQAAPVAGGPAFPGLYGRWTVTSVHVPECGIVRVYTSGLTDAERAATARTASCMLAGGEDVTPPTGFRRLLTTVSPDARRVTVDVEDEDHEWRAALEFERATHLDVDAVALSSFWGPPVTVAGHRAWNELGGTTLHPGDPTPTNHQIVVDAGDDRLLRVHLIDATYAQLEAVTTRFVTDFDRYLPPDDGDQAPAVSFGRSARVATTGPLQRWVEDGGEVQLVAMATRTPQVGPSRTADVASRAASVLDLPVDVDLRTGTWSRALVLPGGGSVWIIAAGLPPARVAEILGLVRYTDGP